MFEKRGPYPPKDRATFLVVCAVAMIISLIVLTVRYVIFQ